jgi:signal recognition particle receptor subunit beta
VAVFDRQRKEISAKIVYYGPGLSGKTTNLKFIYEKLKPEHKGKLMTLATQTDRTIFFDFLPIELGDVRGMKTRFQLYTVPGQVFYNATRKMVLKNVDGIVFVADSRRETLGDNQDSWNNLVENLASLGINLDSLSIVFQYNKQDLPTAMPIEELNAILNPRGYPYFSAVAHKGTGVLETLTTVCKLVIRNLKEPSATASPSSTPAETLSSPASSKGAKSNDWEILPAEGSPKISGSTLILPVRVRHGKEEILLKVTVELEGES